MISTSKPGRALSSISHSEQRQRNKGPKIINTPNFLVSCDRPMPFSPTFYHGGEMPGYEVGFYDGWWVCFEPRFVLVECARNGMPFVLDGSM